MENTDDFLVKTISSPEGASDRSEIFFFVLLLDQTNVWPDLDDFCFLECWMLLNVLGIEEVACIGIVRCREIWVHSDE
jgi:hypothetical protein